MRACAGGELQRFAIAVVAAQQADVYMIDEPSSYLDVRQRLKAAQARQHPPHCAFHYSVGSLLSVMRLVYTQGRRRGAKCSTSLGMRACLGGCKCVLWSTGVAT